MPGGQEEVPEEAQGPSTTWPCCEKLTLAPATSPARPVQVAPGQRGRLLLHQPPGTQSPLALHPCSAGPCANSRPGVQVCVPEPQASREAAASSHCWAPWVVSPRDGTFFSGAGTAAGPAGGACTPTLTLRPERPDEKPATSTQGGGTEERDTDTKPATCTVRSSSATVLCRQP